MKKFLIFSLTIVAFSIIIGSCGSIKSGTGEGPDDFKMNQSLVQIMKALDKTGANVIRDSNKFYNLQITISRLDWRSFEVYLVRGIYSSRLTVHFLEIDLDQDMGLVHIAKIENLHNGSDLIRRFVFKPFFDEKTGPLGLFTKKAERPLIYESGQMEMKSFLSAYGAVINTALEKQFQATPSTAKTF